MGGKMQDILKAGLVAVTMLSANAALAGGPVLIEEGNNELIEEAPARQAGILPVLGVLLLVGLVASAGGGGDSGGVVADDPQQEPEPVKVFPQP